MARAAAVLLVFLLAEMAVQAMEPFQPCGRVATQVQKGKSVLIGVSFYSPGQRCRWLVSAAADSPPGTYLNSTCHFDIPMSVSCKKDRVRVWTSGSSDRGDPRTLCGRGNATLLSDGAALELRLFAVRFSPGGSFTCNVTAVSSDAECECGMRKESRVVGGEEAGVNEFPYMAALGAQPEAQGPLRVFCGASLISRSFALTAAHCFFVEAFNISRLRLAVGDHDLTTDTDTPYSKWYGVSSYYPHPQFNLETKDYDIMLVRPDENVVMGPGAMPICLPFRFTSRRFAGEIVEVLGWGSKRHGGPTSNTLQKAEVSIVAPAICRAFLKASSGGARRSYKQICTTSDGRDTCQSDSGGPIVWQDPDTGRDFILGVSSYGFGCASGHPSVYTSVISFLNWTVGIANKGDKLCKPV